MARHQSQCIEFKRQVAREFLGGEISHGLAKRHDISRNLIRVWVEKYEAGAFDEDGLHNVTRLAHTENPPLKHIAADPQRIGPLMDEDLKEAELLIRRPLAAMGYEFGHHEDVWRILSHCNYYPVLVQTFCAKLLEALHKEVARKKRPVTLITDRHVRDALEDDDVRKEIGEKFDATCKVDQRYLLITCVIADRILRDNAAGRMDEGMSVVDVMDQACDYWAEAFDKANRLSIVEDLLDEMEGMGLLRQTSGGQWTLRSHAILRLLGDDERIRQRLYEFVGRAAPRIFDPRAMHRPLNLPTFAKVPSDYPCPLTLGQEHGLFNIEKADRPVVDIVFGNALSDVGVVALALQNADPEASDGTKLGIVARNFSSATDLMDLLRQHRPGGPRVVVVDAKTTEWDATWIEQALRQRPLREGRVKLIMVGGPQHALRWVRNPRFLVLPPQVRVMPLLPWADAFIDDELDRQSLAPEWFRDELRRVTGGFNRPMAGVFRNAPSTPERFIARVQGVADKLVKDRGLLVDLGLSAPLDEVFRHMQSWSDAGRIRLDEIADGVLAEVPAAYVDMVSSWASGLVDRWDGQPFVHTLSLMASVDGPALRRRLWQARVREVFPFIERVRLAFVGRHEAQLRACLPIEKNFNGTIRVYDDPWRLELYGLYHLLEDGLSKRDATLLYDCYKLRTAMAHGDPGDETRIERASSIWQQAADNIATGCPGWDWPRCGQTLVLLIGPSGAGKSTYARRHFDLAEVVSSDAIREELFGGRDVGGDQAEVFQRVRLEIAHRLFGGCRAVVDATNLKSADRLANARLAPPDVPAEYVVIERPMAAKAAGAGGRKPWVIEAHSATFAEELPYILNGDGLPNVRVTVPPEAVLPVPSKAAA